MSMEHAYKAELSLFLRGFGNNVRRVRAARGLSQEMLSFGTGLHRTEIGKIERGMVEPRLSTVLILADALGATLDQLVDGLPVPQERKPAPNSRPRRTGA